MHKHPTAVAFTYILPDGEHKLGGTVFLKSKKPVRARPLLPSPCPASTMLLLYSSLCPFRVYPRDC